VTGRTRRDLKHGTHLAQPAPPEMGNGNAPARCCRRARKRQKDEWRASESPKWPDQKEDIIHCMFEETGLEGTMERRVREEIPRAACRAKATPWWGKRLEGGGKVSKTEKGL